MNSTSEQAFALHEAGDLPAAERGYRDWLRRSADDGAVMHALGVLLLQTGRCAEACEWLGKLVAAGPPAPAAIVHYNYGVALRAMRRPDEALASFERARAAAPEFAAAVTACVDLLREQSVARLGSGRWAEALASAEAALGLQPASADTFALRGNALVGLGRLDAALASFDAALGVQPAHYEALCNRAAILAELGRWTAALDAAERAVALDPRRVEGHLQRGAGLLGLDRHDAALRAYDAAVASRPESAAAHAGRAATLQHLGRHAEALASSDRAIALAPRRAAGHFNRAAALRDLGEVEAAIRGFETVLALQPDDALTHCNLGGLHLLQGRFEQGWECYEWRSRLPGSQRLQRLSTPVWNGEELSGTTLFVYQDQGLGDAIQYARYVRLAERRSARVVMAVQRPLVRLLASVSPTLELLADTQTPAAFEHHCPLGSLPRGFRTAAASIPVEVPYLRAEPERVAAWRQRLGTDGFKIGVCWQGSTLRTGLGRAFKLTDLQPLAALAGVRLISLQRHAGVEQLQTLPHGLRVETLGEEFDAGPDAFLDTAAVMHCLDLVITCDTAMAHLAGALARPAWVALKRVPDWRWMLGRSDSPWYPTLRLFRQRDAGHWAPVFEDMRREVAGLLR